VVTKEDARVWVPMEVIWDAAPPEPPEGARPRPPAWGAPPPRPDGPQRQAGWPTAAVGERVERAGERPARPMQGRKKERPKPPKARKKLRPQDIDEEY